MLDLAGGEGHDRASMDDWLTSSRRDIDKRTTMRASEAPLYRDVAVGRGQDLFDIQVQVGNRGKTQSEELPASLVTAKRGWPRRPTPTPWSATGT